MKFSVTVILTYSSESYQKTIDDGWESHPEYYHKNTLNPPLGSFCPSHPPPTLGQNCTASGALECVYPSDNCCCGQCKEVFFCASDSTTGGGIWQLNHVCPAGCSEGEHILERHQTNFITSCHRYCHLTKLPCPLPQRPCKASNNTSRSRKGNKITIYCIQHCKLQRPPGNHGWRRDHPDREGVWHLPADQHNECYQHRQHVVQN